MLKIGLDIDDTCGFWYSIYLNRFGTPKNNYEITKNVERVLRKDKDFWLNLPVKHKPDFDVTLYCTKRVNAKSWTKEWLRRNGYPVKPVYQVLTQTRNKAELIKGRIDVFIDDSVSNYIQMNKSGVPCLLMDAEFNKEFETPYRIYSLNYDEIEQVYRKFRIDNSGTN